MVRKFSRVIVGLLLVFAVIVGMISIKHPIILKWLSGSARIIGSPTRAKVYTDGQYNADIKVYHVSTYWGGEPADYYILHFPYANKSRLKFLGINKKDNYAGGPSATNIDDYDNVDGLLFQSEVGSNFTPMQNDIKGFNFDPQLVFVERQITLNIPTTAKELKCDSLRIVF